MDVKIEPTWKQQLGAEFDKPYFATLAEQVRQAYRMGPCFPPSRLVFNAFNLCPFNEVKVVIMGQDPYHEPGQAMGLSFSVPEGVVMPPSLINIFKEIEMDDLHQEVLDGLEEMLKSTLSPDRLRILEMAHDMIVAYDAHFRQVRQILNQAQGDLTYIDLRSPEEGDDDE